MLGFCSFQHFGDFTHLEVSPPALPLAPQRFRAIEKVPCWLTICYGNAKLASGNLKQQCQTNLQVCEGVGANATGGKGAAPGEGCGGSALTQNNPMQPNLIRCCPGALGHPLASASSMVRDPEGPAQEEGKCEK